MLLQSLAMSTHVPADGPGAAATPGDCCMPGVDIAMPGELSGNGEVTKLPGEMLPLLAGTSGDCIGDASLPGWAVSVGGRGSGELGVSEMRMPVNCEGEASGDGDPGLPGAGDCPVLGLTCTGDEMDAGELGAETV